MTEDATASAIASCSATAAQSYTVTSGNTLTTIAKAYSVGVCDIANANNITNIDLIYVGQVLTIPSGICTPDTTSCIAKTPSCNATSTQYYTVQSKDDLESIAEKYAVGACDLAKANNIANPDFILTGANITIPAGICTADTTSCVKYPSYPATANCSTGGPNSYLVRSGDTFNNIAKDFNVTASSLQAANPGIENIDVIYPDQLLNITVCPNTQCTVATYTVVSGDVFVDLAPAYGSTVGQILASNQAVDPTMLEIGQQILLPQKCGKIC